MDKKDCKDCCKNCKGCKNCCKDCKDCKKNCEDCEYCEDCKYCKECKHCEDCKHCKDCKYCKHCEDCKHCKDCKYCKHCEDCKYYCKHCKRYCKSCKHCIKSKEVFLLCSIEDTIDILDNALIQPLDSISGSARLTNRISIAHLELERGLKALLHKSGKSGRSEGHHLGKLYVKLMKCNKDAANSLTEAFNNAVGFFGYDIEKEGFEHFRALVCYLSKVGTEEIFMDMRYWLIEPRKAIKYKTLLKLHREILYRLQCCLPFSDKPIDETIDERVERRVREAMTNGGVLANGDNKTSIDRYCNWLNKHLPYRTALEEAVEKKFIVKEGDEFVKQTLCDAFKELEQSKDPAVWFYIKKLREKYSITSPHQRSTFAAIFSNTDPLTLKPK